MTDRDEVAQEAYRRATVLTEINDSLGRISKELTEIRSELAQRPDRLESTLKRRGSVVALIAIIFFAVQTVDARIEMCSPGARTYDGINYVGDVELSEFDADELQRLLRQEVPVLCDVTAPLHTNDAEDSWPTTANLAGLAFYALVFGGLIVWWRYPCWRDKKISD